jgi:ribA/ribD-fused uncharacterized protein
MIEHNFHFFWSSSFSQWANYDMLIGGTNYNCCEQWMMAEKARLFKDEETRAKIMAANNWDKKNPDEEYAPGKQKALGRLVKNFNPETWNSKARSIVFIGNYVKFSSNPKLRKQLLDTKEKEIVEASPVDFVWGIGLKASDNRALDKSKWRGTNWLGQAIQLVREQLKEEDRGWQNKLDVDSLVKDLF